MHTAEQHRGCSKPSDTLRDFTSRKVVCLSAKHTLGEAAGIMAARHISSIVVVDTANHPIGIVTERNILRAMQAGHQHVSHLQQIMSAPVVTVSESLDCQQAYRVCQREGIRHLVIVNRSGEVSGAISETDFRLHMNLEALAGVRPLTSVMSRAALTMPPEAHLREALNLMQAQHATCVIVVEQNKPIGIVTERDVVLLYSQQHNDTNPRLAQVMSSPVITVKPETSLNDAAELMLRNGTRHLAVVNSGDSLVGLIGEHELTQSIVQELSGTLLDNPGSFLHTLVNTIPDLVWLKDPQGNYLACNTAFERLYGCRESEILGKTDYDFVSRELADFFRRNDERAMMEGPRSNLEWLTFSDGFRGLFETIKSPMRDRDGRILGVLGVARDISATHQIHEALRENELKLRNLIEAIPDAIQFKDGEGRWLEYNTIAAELLGLSHIDCHGKSDTELAELAPPGVSDVLLYCRDTDIEVWKSGKMQHVEELIPQADGSYLAFDVIKLPLFNDDGSRKGLLIIGRDITQRKRTEEALHESLQAFNDLVARVPVGVFKYRTRPDGNHHFDYISPRWCEMSGIPADAVYQNAQAAFSHVPPEDMQEFQQAMAKAIAEVKPFERDIRVVRNGESFWLHLEAVPTRQANGDIVWDGIQYDITERWLANERRRLTASVFTDTHEGIVITDPQACIVEVNEAFSRITGYSRDEVLGKKPGILKSGHQDGEFYQTMWQAISDHGHWSGEVWNRRKDGEVYAEHLNISAVRDERGEVSHYAGVFADITRLKENERKLEHIAHYDALTGIPNRALLADRMRQAVAQSRRSGNMLAVCYLDLDGFKPINDKYGHEMGDFVLVEMAQRMKQQLRGGDTVARIGGDEFVLLMGLTRLNECEQAFSRVLEAITAPIKINGQQVEVSASLGIALYPKDDSDPDTLLRHADQAMYQAKQNGKNRFHLYDPEHDRQLRAQRDSLQRLRQAIETREFKLYYQPKVNLADSKVIGVEALVRWHHPERGLLLPDEFLPAMMGNELGIDLGEWVIETALQQITEWKQLGINLTVSINISAEHLLRPSFSEHLRRSLAQYPSVTTDDLELEILESAAITDLNRASQVLAEGRAMGVRFSLDDFGTGYSSLSYFSKLPVSALKIDQEFVRNMLTDPEDLSIVESVIFLAQAFNRTVIAEGVETPEHYAMLLHLGCPSGQGFGIAEPMPPHLLRDWLDDWHSNASRAYRDTIELPREDVVLLVAATSHRTWIDRVIAYVEGSGDERPPMDPQQCRFGRWYHGTGQNRYAALTEYTALDGLHHSIHETAHQLVTLTDEACRDEAKAGINRLHSLRDEFLAGLDKLIDRVKSDHRSK